METNDKFKALDELVQTLGISEKEVNEWFSVFTSRLRLGLSPFAHYVLPTDKTSDAIQTPLPIVYKKGSVIEVSPYLDLQRKNEVWGFQLPCGVFVKKTLGIKGEVPYHKFPNTNSSTYPNVRMHVEGIIFAGIRGKLPAKEVMTIDENAEKLFEATVQILNDNGIQADGCRGALWCYDASRGIVYRYHLSLKCCIHQFIGGMNYYDEKKERLAFCI